MYKWPKKYMNKNLRSTYPVFVVNDPTFLKEKNDYKFPVLILKCSLATQHQFRELVRLAEEYEKQRLSTKLIKSLLYAPTQDIAEKCLKMVPKEKGAGN